jgi:hypothetical protein
VTFLNKIKLHSNRKHQNSRSLVCLDYKDAHVTWELTNQETYLLLAKLACLHALVSTTVSGEYSTVHIYIPHYRRLQENGSLTRHQSRVLYIPSGTALLHRLHREARTLLFQFKTVLQYITIFYSSYEGTIQAVQNSPYQKVATTMRPTTEKA